MNAVARVFDTQITSTQTNDNDIRFVLLNRFLEAVHRDELYESDAEERPSEFALVTAANALSFISLRELDGIEIEPYSGELSIIWREGRDNRVKAMFGRAKDSFTVYHEQMAHGRVVERHLETSPDSNYLRNRL